MAESDLGGLVVIPQSLRVYSRSFTITIYKLFATSAQTEAGLLHQSRFASGPADLGRGELPPSLALVLVRPSQPAIVFEVGVAYRDFCDWLDVELLADPAVGGSCWLERADVAESILDDLDSLPVTQETPATHLSSLSDESSFLPPNLSGNLLF